MSVFLSELIKGRGCNLNTNQSLFVAELVFKEAYSFIRQLTQCALNADTLCSAAILLTAARSNISLHWLVQLRRKLLHGYYVLKPYGLGIPTYILFAVRRHNERFMCAATYPLQIKHNANFHS
jgi:hypothetical protein